MSKAQKTLLESVQWLIDHDEPIPPDLMAELRAAGIPVNSAQHASNMLEGIKAEVAAIRAQIEAPPATIPITQVNFEPILSRLDALLDKLASISPNITVDVPKQPAPVINVQPAPVTIMKEKREKKRVVIKRQNDGSYVMDEK